MGAYQVRHSSPPRLDHSLTPPCSPETITALEEERLAGEVPNSPRPSRRRSSTGPVSPALRPVIIDRDDDGTAVPKRREGEEGEEDEEGPVATSPHSGPAIDEVELIFKR